MLSKKLLLFTNMISSLGEKNNKVLDKLEHSLISNLSSLSPNKMVDAMSAISTSNNSRLNKLPSIVSKVK